MAEYSRFRYRGNIVHKVLDPFVDPDLYEELESAWPEYEQIARGRTGDNKLFQRSAVEVLGSEDIADIWQGFFEELLAGFTDRVEDIFGVEFPKDRAIRGTEKAEFYVDVQFAVNSPPQTKCRVRGPHIDSPMEAYGCCFYMKHPNDESKGGDLQFYKWVDEMRFIGKAEIDDSRVEVIETLPYGANIGGVFINNFDGVHGITEREVTHHPRRYINIIGEYPKPHFELPR